MPSIINAATSGGLISTADTSGVLQLQTASTTAMTINASQNVGIGNTSPAVPLQIGSGAADATIRFGATSNGYDIGRNNSTGYFTQNATQASPYNQFIWQQSGTESVRINTYGIGLGGTNPASGMGITFPATQSASSDANTLDDYEEGTFTPTVIGSSTAGTASYSIQQGRYTKTGNRVSISIVLLWSGGTGIGALRFAGLPFTANGQVPFACYNANVAMTASHYMQVITAGVGSTLIDINSVPTGGGSDANVAYDGAGLIMVGGNYDVN